MLIDPNNSIFSLTVAFIASNPGAKSLRGSNPLPCKSFPASMYLRVALANDNWHSVLTFILDTPNDIAFCMQGGNLIIKDKTNNGTIFSEGLTFLCNNGFLKIENCKMTNNDFNLSVYNDAIVQIDNGEFSGLISLSAGNLIINGGLFKSGLDVNFEPFTDKIPNAIINGGEFIGNQARLYIWFPAYAKNVKLSIIFTGGDAKYFVKRIKNAIFADCEPVIFGLNRILEYNAEEL